MGRRLRDRPARIAFGMLAALGCLSADARAQESTAKTDAAAIVEGVVREVFRSPRQGRTDVLVQIDIQRSEAGRASRGGMRVACPAPGDSVYVHLIQGANAPARIPAELSQVRAYLVPRARGGWEGASSSWFDLTSDRAVARDPAESAPAATEPSPNPAPTAPAPSSPTSPGGKAVLHGLGVTVEPLDTRGRLALRVAGVERGGPAQRAGIEVGDLIAGVDGQPLANASQLDERSRRGGPITLDIVDVNTGKTVPVEVATVATDPPAKADADAGRSRDRDPSPAPAAPARSLGISTESVSVGGRAALKVVRVTPGGAGAKAGLEVGDVLVGANGAAITGPEQLAAALRKSGPALTLMVRDVRSGKDTPVEVRFAGQAQDRPSSPIELPNAPRGGNPEPTPGASAGRLGAVTELTFFDTELAVRVTEVEPGGPASRAGIQPGTIIVKADGKSVLHPNDLIEAARKAAASIRLTIVEPRGDRQAEVDVDLRAR